MKILVLNCGSSSIKFQVFDMSTEAVLLKGLVEKIGEAEPVFIYQSSGDPKKEIIAARNHVDSLHIIRDLLVDPAKSGISNINDLAAVGHRVVHGGDQFVASQLVTADVEHIIEQNFAIAPLHNPPNLQGIHAAKQFFPEIPHVAVFDTAFHQTMPPKAYLYAIRYDLYEKDRIRRYGFHGTSHRYVVQRAAEILGVAKDEFTGITAHLGNGCSLAAVQNGKSVDTTMGLTPLEGVPMGTRSGDIDAAIIFHLAERKGLSLKDINNILQKDSGLKGVSGLTNDLRDVEAGAAQGNVRAQLALDVYAYRVRKYIGAYLAVLHNPRAIIFTGGVGERGVAMRARILDGLDHLGIIFDETRNKTAFGTEGEITAAGSSVRAIVVPTNEELMIARDTRDVAKAK